MNEVLREKTIEAALALGVERFDPERAGDYLLIFDKLLAGESVVVIKFDGERPRPGYVVVISKGALGDDYVHIEDDNLIEAFAKSLAQYSELVGLSVPGVHSKEWIARCAFGTRGRKAGLKGTWNVVSAEPLRACSSLVEHNPTTHAGSKSRQRRHLLDSRFRGNDNCLDSVRCRLIESGRQENGFR